MPLTEGAGGGADWLWGGEGGRMISVQGEAVVGGSAAPAAGHDPPAGGDGPWRGAKACGRGALLSGGWELTWAAAPLTAEAGGHLRGGRGQEESPSGAPRSFLPGPEAGPAGALPCAP